MEADLQAHYPPRLATFRESGAGEEIVTVNGSSQSVDARPDGTAIRRPWTIWTQPWVTPDVRANLQSLYATFWILAAIGIAFTVGGGLIQVSQGSGPVIAPGAELAWMAASFVFLLSALPIIRLRSAFQQLFDGLDVS